MPSYIEKLTIDEETLLSSEKNKTARERAVTDLLEQNHFSVSDFEGPFIVKMSVIENKLLLNVASQHGMVGDFYISLAGLRRVIKDYHIICESYYEAITTSDPRKVESIDMGRRGVHDEGAQILEDLLDDNVVMDFDTLRKMFSIIYVLQIR